MSSTHIHDEANRTHPEPPFLEPLTSGFVYTAWSVDPVTMGPFVRGSAARRRKIDEVRGLADMLTRLPDVEGARVFEAAVIPPLPDMPRYDVVMLVRANTRERAASLATEALLRQAEPNVVFVAGNAARFGATETADDQGAPFLLNHFTGPIDRSGAVAAWRKASGWFTAKMGVDNSTLLRTEESAPYLIINYVRLPQNPRVFLARQLLRPSFHRYVRALLKRNQLTSLPLFVRRVW